MENQEVKIEFVDNKELGSVVIINEKPCLGGGIGVTDSRFESEKGIYDVDVVFEF